MLNCSIWVQLLDRRQQRLELVLLSVDNFTEPPPNMYNVENNLNPPTPAVQVIYTQHSDLWINVSSYRNVLFSFLWFFRFLFGPSNNQTSPSVCLPKAPLFQYLFVVFLSSYFHIQNFFGDSLFISKICPYHHTPLFVCLLSKVFVCKFPLIYFIGMQFCSTLSNWIYRNQFICFLIQNSVLSNLWHRYYAIT
jgi:hypothetical protein